TREDYERLRREHAAKTEGKKLLTLGQARANRTPIDWTTYIPPKPEFLGVRVYVPGEISIAVRDLIEYIDWSPFFHAWELRGRYPAIFDDPKIGKEARELFDDAQELLERIAAKDLLIPRGVYAFWPANAAGDDFLVYADDARSEKIATFYFLRQQMQKPPGQFNHCLADYVAPLSNQHSAAPTASHEHAKNFGVGNPQLADYLGGFAVSIHGAD